MNDLLLHFREIRCNEGKEVGLHNGVCSEKPYEAKNQVDFMVRRTIHCFTQILNRYIH